MSSQKEKAKQRLKRENDIVERNKEKDSAIFDDQKLERTLKLTKEFLEKVPIFVEKAKYTLSKAELKLLEDQRQELSKLKM
ncbi:hypothetical protein J5751_06575 [bacterium]|nr:hypothetical protein [bacterium]